MSESETILETIAHIQKVQSYMFIAITKVMDRLIKHDQSKLSEPELSVFSSARHALSELTYGSPEYMSQMKEHLAPALQHHYQKNAHHPEYWPNGIRDMSLIDLLEMICDWTAASQRHRDGSISRSIDINAERFGYGDELRLILHNTIKDLT